MEVRRTVVPGKCKCCEGELGGERRRGEAAVLDKIAWALRLPVGCRPGLGFQADQLRLTTIIHSAAGQEHVLLPTTIHA